MLRLRQAFLVALAIAAAAGCNAILDNDVHELAQDAATGTSGTGGGTGATGGVGGTAGQGGGTGGQGGTAGQGGATGGQGGTAGQGGNPPDDAPIDRGGSGGQGATGGQGGAAGATTGGAAGQGGSNRDASDDGVAGSVNRDSSTGSGDADGAPPISDANMADAPNDASCSNQGATECRGSSVYVCIGGIWIETQKCPYACVVNVCGGVCVPGSTQCTGNTPQTCDATGTWQTGATCPYVCASGACTGMCVPGTTVPCGDATTCNDGAVQTCDFAGTLGACNPGPSNCAIVPAGWEPVAKPASGTCPAGFGSPQTMYTSATGAPYTCSCNCGGTQSCAGSATLNESTSCAGTPTNSFSFTMSSTCVGSYIGDIISGYGYTLSNVVYEPSPVCYTNPAPIFQPSPQTTTVTICTPNLTCPSGACLSSSQVGTLCVAKYGIEACPSGYPNGTTYSTYYEDTRSCGSCACGSTLSCTFNSVLLDNLTTCSTSGHPYWMNATTTCMQAPGNYPLSGVKANGTSTGTPNCVETAPSNPMGGVELGQGSIATVCCK